MKLHYAPASPFARKVHVSVIELGLSHKVDLVFTQVVPGQPNIQYVNEHNPLGKIPALQLSSGETLFDSSTICEYLDSISPDTRLLPRDGLQRYQTLTHHALAHGICDAAVSLRYETFLRPETHRWSVWIEDQWAKINRALAWFQNHTGQWQGDMDLGQVTLGCALGYLDFRSPEFDWRNDYPALTSWFADIEQRDSFLGTRPDAIPVSA